MSIKGNGHIGSGKKIIELVGGVGSGKSRVLDILEKQYGAVIIQADLVAKELEKKGQPGYQQIVEAFGPEILAGDGELDKGKLASLIFSDEKAMRRINGIIHPMVWQWISGRINEITSGLVVVETAIPDKRPDDIYDEVWYVYTLRDLRIQRLMESRGYSLERCLQIMGNQLSEDVYRAGADYVIDNSGSLEETEEQIRKRLAIR